MIKELDPASQLSLKITQEEMKEVKPERLATFVAMCVSKLRGGGTIIFKGTDVYELAKSLYTRKIGLVEFNHNSEGTVFGMKDIEECLRKHKQIRIMKKRVNKFEFCLEAERVRTTV